MPLQGVPRVSQVEQNRLSPPAWFAGNPNTRCHMGFCQLCGLGVGSCKKGQLPPCSSPRRVLLRLQRCCRWHLYTEAAMRNRFWFRLRGGFATHTQSMLSLPPTSVPLIPLWETANQECWKRERTSQILLGDSSMKTEENSEKVQAWRRDYVLGLFALSVATLYYCLWTSLFLHNRNVSFLFLQQQFILPFSWFSFNIRPGEKEETLLKVAHWKWIYNTMNRNKTNKQTIKK